MAALLFFSSKDMFVVKVLSHPWLVYVGDISYSLYLVHWPLIVFNSLENIKMFTHVSSWVTILLVVPLAIALHKLIENPFRYAEGYSARIIFVRSVFALAVTVFALSCLPHWTDLGYERFILDPVPVANNTSQVRVTKPESRVSLQAIIDSYTMPDVPANKIVSAVVRSNLQKCRDKTTGEFHSRGQTGLAFNGGTSEDFIGVPCPVPTNLSMRCLDPNSTKRKLIDGHQSGFSLFTRIAREGDRQSLSYSSVALHTPTGCIIPEVQSNHYFLHSYFLTPFKSMTSSTPSLILIIY
jgi:hypothetical protein